MSVREVLRHRRFAYLVGGRTVSLVGNGLAGSRSRSRSWTSPARPPTSAWCWPRAACRWWCSCCSAACWPTGSRGTWCWWSPTSSAASPRCVAAGAAAHRPREHRHPDGAGGRQRRVVGLHLPRHRRLVPQTVPAARAADRQHRCCGWRRRPPWSAARRWAASLVATIGRAGRSWSTRRPSPSRAALLRADPAAARRDDAVEQRGA